MKHKPITMREAEVKAKEVNKSLSAYDFNPDCCVQIKTDEGCEWFLRSAFALTYGRFYLIFGEHHHPICIAKNDVTWFAQYVMMHTKLADASSYLITNISPDD